VLSDRDSGELDCDAVLVLAGELDLLTEPLLTALLEGPIAAPGLRVVDLSGVTFADSSGLAPLLRHRHRLEIRGESPQLRRIINLLVDLTAR
jgi:anti-anti-sigma factor